MNYILTTLECMPFLSLFSSYTQTPFYWLDLSLQRCRHLWREPGINLFGCWGQQYIRQSSLYIIWGLHVFDHFFPFLLSQVLPYHLSIHTQPILSFFSEKSKNPIQQILHHQKKKKNKTTAKKLNQTKH